MQKVNFTLSADSGKYLTVYFMEQRIVDKTLQKGVHRLPEFLRKRFSNADFVDDIEDFIHENKNIVLKIVSYTTLPR